ncbi:AI-2E family transporter [Oligoflexus tunisiensis]|uniref:AI-2E family transporter n=1 Tax=Oligoflexus tunisiensis TaxID=708132 RepID=UPI000B08A016|nr:AI-2E family transporter [Oligoflexus tunisiensis]
MAEQNAADSENRVDFWSDRHHIGSILLAAITLLIFYGFALVIQPFAKALVWSLALAISVFPLHRWMETHWKNPNVAAALTTVIIGFAILAPLTFVTIEIGNQASGVMEKLQSPELQQSVDRFLQSHPSLSLLRTEFNLKGDIKSLTTDMASRVPVLATGTIWKLTEAAIVLLIIFFLMRDRVAFLVTTRRFMPLTEKECDRVFRQVQDTVRATVYGHLFMALIQGTLGGLVFWAIGLPAPLLWGAVMTILAVLPILGAAIVWIPAAALLVFQGSWGKALILVFFGSVVIGLIDNLLYPYLVGKRIREHTLLVFLSIVGGIMFLGAAGIVAGPLLLALTDVFLSIWKNRTVPRHWDTNGTT